jgi:hypothetical protein
MFVLPEPQKFKMRDKLDEAIAKAKAKNPAVKLVRIFGAAVDKDGTVMLGQQGKFMPRWEFAFMDDKNGEAPPQFITVLYLAPKVPMVNDNAGNVSTMPPLSDGQVSMLANSDVVATVFASLPDNKPCGGFDNDTMVYMIQNEEPVVHISNWKGQTTRLDAITLAKK